MSQQSERIQLREQDEELEIDLLELLYYYRSKLLWILAAFVTGALLAGLITFFCITPKYEGTAKLYMVSASSDSIVNLADLDLGTSLSKDYEELLKSRPIFEEIIQDQNLEYEYEQLLEMTSIATVEDTRILSVTAESPDPQEARNIANALADQAVSKLPKLMDTSKPNIAEYAIVPEEPSSPSYSKNIMIGALLLTLLMLGGLTFACLTDDTLKSAEDVEAAFGIMPLTVIPESDIGVLSEKNEKEERSKRKKKGTKRGKKR